VRSIADRILLPLIQFLHEGLGLSPNRISAIGFVAGLAGAALTATGNFAWGMAVMAVSQVIDGLDGGVARRYNLLTPLGARLEIVFDRVNELAMLAALACAGQVHWKLSLLAFTAILLVSAIEPLSKFDPGFKRFMLYFGWLAGVMFHVRGFELAVNVIFFANLAVFAAGTVIVEYRLQREIDDSAVAARESLRASGAPLPPDDPPTIISKIASWF
jgi:phosphatidylglycerophosphate synthase